jgi:hypothetical protein
VLGNGTVASLGEAKLNADVRSPETARRHLVMFLSIMPGYSDMKRRSINRMSDVWSNTCEFTQPPLLQGEMNNHGDTHAHSVRAGRIFRTTGEDFIRRVDVGEALGSGLRDGRGGT